MMINYRIQLHVFFVSCYTTLPLLFTDHWTTPIPSQTSTDQQSNKLYPSETFLKTQVFVTFCIKNLVRFLGKKTPSEISPLQKYTEGCLKLNV